MKWAVLIFAAVISGCQGQDFAKWCPNITNDISSCTASFINNVPEVSNLFSDPSKAMNIQTIMSSIMSTLCQGQTRTEMKELYRCVYKKMFACIPREWTKAFPDIDATLASLKYMCDNINDVDFNCVGTRSNAMSTCVYQAISAQGQPDVSTADKLVAFVCSFHPKTVACYQTAFGTCPKRTAEVLTKALEYQKPMGCDACSTRPSLILLISITIMAFVKKWTI